MPQIVAIRVKDDASRDTIAVVLSQDAICLSPDGEPWSAVSLDPEMARSLAHNLLGLAREIEDQQQSESQATGSQAEIRSILVFHDGSLQSTRAFNLALDLASRSDAWIQLIGIYGVCPDKCEPSSFAEDYIWLRGWLEKLFALYLHQAELRNVQLRTTLLAATDHQEMAELFTSGNFDLVVLPRRFSSDGPSEEGFQRLRQSLSGTAKSSILFCS